jgi:hypothetical protein
MKVSIFSDIGELLWSYETRCDQSNGFTSCTYLQDGTQEKIIGALFEALRQGFGRMFGHIGLDEPNIVTERSPPGGVYGDVPIT